MTANIDFYRQAWQEVPYQPHLKGLADPWLQFVGRYVRAIACKVSGPFAVPVGLTAAATGMNPEYVGKCLGELVRHNVLRVEQRGEPGRYTRYVFGPGGIAA